MRVGWTYKEYLWSEVLTIINGKNQSAVECEDGEFPIYGSGGIMGYANNYLCPENCVIVGRKGNINKPIFVESKFWNVDTAFGLSAKEDILSPRYLYYFCVDYDFERLNKAVTIPSLTKADLLKIQISLPPKSHQEAIVSELDEINSLLALKREQLQTYDKLAQSLFYEMFGDPVENEKGWEVKKLGDACSMKAGKAIKATELSDGYVFPCYGGNGIRGYINKVSHTESAPIIGRQGAYCGTVNFATAPFYATEHAVVVNPLQEMDIYWLYYTLINLKLSRFAKGQAQPGISVGNLSEEVYLPLPPLPLQQQFATRIAQIEEQKQQVQAAIERLETLLASRMQYWFE